MDASAWNAAKVRRTVSGLGKLRRIFEIPLYRLLGFLFGAIYFVLFLIALQDLTLGGRSFDLLTADPARMFDRTGTFTFEPVLQVTVPGATLLVSPLNMFLGLILAVLAGLNLSVTVLAFREPAACRFNRSGGVLAGLPALLAGGACCAPSILMLLGLQASSLLIAVQRVLLPVSFVLLAITLKLVLDRTDPSQMSNRKE